MQAEERARVYFLWVDWKRRVISFERVPGFNELRFPTHEAMFQFAIERGNEGFGIQ